MYRYSEEAAVALELEAELADYIDDTDHINIKKNTNFIFFQVRRPKTMLAFIQYCTGL